jgi:hypothetical protein
MAWSSFAKGAGGRRAAAARSRWFVRAHAMAIAPRQPNVACGATQLPWLPVNSSRSPRARWIRLEQAEQATSPVARRGAARDRGIAFVRASAPRVSASPAVRDEKGQICCGERAKGIAGGEEGRRRLAIQEEAGEGFAAHAIVLKKRGDRFNTAWG